MDGAILDELYSAPLDEFVDRRKALAKQLKDDGHAEEAAEVSAARKPSLPVWAANQLARRNRPAVDELLEASGELRTAIGKGDREAFGAAQQRQGAALRKLRDAAKSLLGDVTDPMLERIVSTFREASVDEELRGTLAAGRLTEEPEPGGFDPLAGLTFTASKPARKTEAKREGRGERVKRAEAALREAKAEQRRLEGEAREAERAAEKARKAADKAAETVHEAEEAVASARR